MKNFPYFLTFQFWLICSSVGCNSPSRSAELTVRNDIQDREFNKIVVNQIHYSRGIALNKFTLSPGDEVNLPYNKISRFQVTREYSDHSNIYEVTCPIEKKGVLIKLIDIHLNRMPAGCRLTKAGEERGGVVSWK